MRTTMNLPDPLFDRVRRRATLEGRTVTSLMEEALRDLLDKVVTPPADPPLPTWNGGGRMLVDIDDRDALWDALDPEETA